MTQFVTLNCSAIADCLRQSAGGVHTAGESRWQFVLGDGVATQATARLIDDFLLFDVPTPACEFAQAPQWLRWNAALAGYAKIALVTNPWRLRLRAEIPVEEDANLASRVAATLAGLRDACRLLEGSQPFGKLSYEKHGLSSNDNASQPHNLFTLLRETGWVFCEH